MKEEKGILVRVEKIDFFATAKIGHTQNFTFFANKKCTIKTSFTL